MRIRRLKEMIEAIAEARDHDLTRAEHLLHLRCEISYPGLPKIVEEMIDNPMVKLVSVMDHTGPAAIRAEETYRVYYQGKHGLSDAEMDAFIHDRKADQETYSAKHRRYIVTRARELGLGLASHDDATPAHVQEAIADGMTIAEFPTTVAAAQASHDGGLKVLMGAEPGSRRLAFRQCLGHRAGQTWRLGHRVQRLCAEQLAARGLSVVRRFGRLGFTARRARRHQVAGRSRRFG